MDIEHPCWKVLLDCKLIRFPAVKAVPEAHLLTLAGARWWPGPTIFDQAALTLQSGLTCGGWWHCAAQKLCSGCASSLPSSGAVTWREPGPWQTSHCTLVNFSTCTTVEPPGLS